MMKKLMSTLLAVGLVLGVTGTVGAAPLVKEKQEFHIGEKPIKSFKDKDTGVVVDVYESPKEEVSALNTFSIASTSGWDFVGSEWWTMNGDYNYYWDSIYHSTGGDYMFRVPAHSSSSGKLLQQSSVILYENDGAGKNTKVASWTVVPRSVSYDYIVRGIGGYVDGTNKKAEFHTRHHSAYKVSGGSIPSIKYYD